MFVFRTRFVLNSLVDVITRDFRLGMWKFTSITHPLFALDTPDSKRLLLTQLTRDPRVVRLFSHFRFGQRIQELSETEVGSDVTERLRFVAEWTADDFVATLS